MRYLKNALVFFFFAVTICLMMGVNPFRGQVVAPMDLLLKYPGYSESGIHLPLVFNQRSDIIDSLLPVM